MLVLRKHMENPQLEKGFLRIASGKSDNDILTALVKANLTATQYQIMMIVIRKTWGWNKKEDWISISQFVELTTKSRKQIIEDIKILVKRSILVKCTTLGKTSLLRPNKIFTEWKQLVKSTTLVKCTLPTSVVQPTQLVKCTTPTKDIYTKDTNTIDIVKNKYPQLSDLQEKDFEEIAEKYQTPLSFVKSKFDDMEIWAGSMPKNKKIKDRNWRLTLMGFVKRDAFQLRKEASTHESKRGIDARNIT